MDFDVIPYNDIVWGNRLGAGSFGSVYKGSYLGIDIAIKEVLPSTEYDVNKYFEREWRIMRECRHPNIVLFLGLSKALDEDGRVFIISEFVPRGNLRQFILSSHPFPWRLRLSFATDVARAVAYLHARQCIHRDLKGENLLITSNERVKVTDFGFARIASRNAEEMRRMTYCGTDGYMSPEIINGHEFDLPTDIFSLGIIFVEIMSRRLVDSRTYTRRAPSFIPDPDEIRRRASPGCPPALIDLALECCLEHPLKRPKMSYVLARLRDIELEVLSRLDDKEGGEHVGSVKLVNHTGRRAMPVFDVDPKKEELEKEGDGEDNVKKMEEEALVTLAGLDIGGGGAMSLGEDGQTWRTARWHERASVLSEYSDASEMRTGHQRLLPSADTSSSLDTTGTTSSISSTAATRPLETALTLKNATPPQHEEDLASSTMTVKGAPTASDVAPHPAHSDIGSIPSLHSVEVIKPVEPVKPIETKYQRAQSEEAEPDKEVPRPTALGTHRFTLVGKDANVLIGKKVSTFTSNFAFAFLPRSLVPSNKCPVCHKRLEQRPTLQCDDCSVIVHVTCSHAAPRHCEGGDVSVTAKST